MYNITHKIRQVIHVFNENYWIQNVAIDIDYLSSNIEKMCNIGMADVVYWEGKKIDFQMAYSLMKEIESAVEERDFVRIYDMLNFELWQMIKRVFEVLFDKNAELLGDYFAKENYAALQKRFPEILKEIDRLEEKKQYKCVRSYGLRGKVIYRKSGNLEFDLYSAYNMMGLKKFRGINFEKYSKIYIWGCNGGTEIDEITTARYFEHMELEIFVTNLYELKQILANYYRKGALLAPQIEWKFNAKEKDLIKDFDMQKKEASYIYICDPTEKLSLLKEFICTNALSSNVGV